MLGSTPATLIKGIESYSFYRIRITYENKKKFTQREREREFPSRFQALETPCYSCIYSHRWLVLMAIGKKRASWDMLTFT